MCGSVPPHGAVLPARVGRLSAARHALQVDHQAAATRCDGYVFLTDRHQSLSPSLSLCVCVCVCACAGLHLHELDSPYLAQWLLGLMEQKTQTHRERQQGRPPAAAASGGDTAGAAEGEAVLKSIPPDELAKYYSRTGLFAEASGQTASRRARIDITHVDLVVWSHRRARAT